MKIIKYLTLLFFVTLFVFACNKPDPDDEEARMIEELRKKKVFNESIILIEKNDKYSGYFMRRKGDILLPKSIIFQVRPSLFPDAIRKCTKKILI